MNFTQGDQPLVDAAFMAHALLRNPLLFYSLDASVKNHLVDALQSTRAIRPGYNNWLLFSAMIKTALLRFSGNCEMHPIDYAIDEHMKWYKGDGAYGDGPEFHWDYYNSFVIQPMLVDVLKTLVGQGKAYMQVYEKVIRRAIRYAEVQERLIAPDGSFPPLGRSLAYRFGAFQLLAQIALMDKLPISVHPAQVRCALTAVIQKMISAPGTFDNKGWLTIGFCGHQPGIGESYISTGSLYLCSTVFLPLGLPIQHAFWSGKAQPWTSKKIWSGTDIPADKAWKEKI